LRSDEIPTDLRVAVRAGGEVTVAYTCLVSHAVVVAALPTAAPPISGVTYIATKRGRSLAWSAPRRFRPAGRSTSPVSLAVSADGALLAVWTTPSADGSGFAIQSALRRAGSLRWSRVMTIARRPSRTSALVLVPEKRAIFAAWGDSRLLISTWSQLSHSR
jgi:hypothetical protein